MTLEPTDDMRRAGVRELFNEQRDPNEPWEDKLARIYKVMRAREAKTQQPTKTLRMLTETERYEVYATVRDSEVSAIALQRAFFAKNADDLAGFVLGEEAG